MNKVNLVEWNQDVMYYRPVWSEQPYIKESLKPNPQTIILFGANIEMVNDFVRTGNKVVHVQFGEQFRQVSETEYQINVHFFDHFNKLVAAWEKHQIKTNNLIQFYDPSEQASDMEITFHLAKVLVDQKKKKWNWLYVYPGDRNTPAKEAMAGFFHSLHAEQPMIKAKTVAIDENTSNIANHLLHELWIQEELTMEVCYQFGKRKVRMLEAWERDKKNIQNQSIWRTNGVYLITGGAGGLGIKTAEYIVSQTDATVVLVGRSTLYEEREKRIEVLNKRGSIVTYVQADISKQSDTIQLIQEIKRRYGKIHGVLHMAAVIRDSFIQSKTYEDINTVIAPKIDGACWLDEALASESLDMFVLYSSLISLIGNAGQVDYAYANRYLDTFSTKRAKLVEEGKRHGVTVSINWPLWQDGGMQVDDGTKEWMKTVMGIEPLPFVKGMYALETAVQSGLNQLAVIVGNEDNVLSRKVGSRVAIDNQYNVEKSNTKQDLLLKTEAYLKQVLAEEIKIPVSKIKSNQSLENYGIDSVLMVALTRQLEKDFGEISKTLFFEYQTITELANFFVDTYREKLISIFQDEQEKKEDEPSGKSPSESIVSPKNGDFITIRRKRHRRRKNQKSSHQREASHLDTIAIIGVSGRYPQAKDLAELWDNLKNGRDSIQEVPNNRWDWRKNFDLDKTRNSSIYTKWGGFMDEVDCFDPLFFNISPKEAELMDPQERIFLETAWHTVENAGYTRQSLGTNKVGVFVGVMYGQYQLFGVEEEIKGNPIAPSSSYASIANRVSYFMNFHGPSIALDTMCSSSLTAVHLACDSIRKGESDIALAGGVNLSLHPSKYLFLSQGKFASTDGRCRSFGEGGDGYVPGEGTGAVLLKPLEKALEDGDYIYGIIRGSSLNHGGKTTGYTVPNPQMQGSLIAEAMKKAGVEPKEISYIEAHGTGTALGDPIEINGLVKAFGDKEFNEQYCAIGSIKSNIGHLESAAGIAGLTKILLQMKHKKLVPSIHSEVLNSNINFTKIPFYVQQQFSDWNQPVMEVDGKEKKLPRIASISSFGAGGANAHIIIQEWNNDRAKQTLGNESQLFILSARNQERLKAYAQQFIHFLKQENQNVNLADLTFTLQTGREVLAERLAIVTDDVSDLVNKLSQFLQGTSIIPGVYFGNERQHSYEPILNGEMGEQFIQNILNKRDWDQLAQAWVAGINPIPWEKVHRTRNAQRISLPVYPFARERYWLNIEDANKTKNVKQEGRLHPLLQKNTSNFEEQCFTTTFTGDEFFLADHLVAGQKVLPGAVYIEMARAAGELSSNQPVKEIKKVVWESPFIFEEKNEQLLSISLFPERDFATFEIWAADEQGERTIHAHGEVHFSSSTQQNENRLNLHSISNYCQREWLGEDCYEHFALKGLKYGESFQSIERIQSSEKESLTELKNTDDFYVDGEEYGLHPSLMDGAFQSILGLMTDQDDQTYLPYRVGSLEIMKGFQRPQFVYVTESQVQREQNERVFNLIITNQAGEQLVKISDFVVRQSLFMQAVANKAETSIGLFYPTWEEKELESSTNSKLEGDILLFAQDQSVYENLKVYVENSGLQARVLLILPGAYFSKMEEDIFSIDITDKQNYEFLLKDLKENNRKPTHIIHLWSDSKREYSESSVKESLDHGVYSLLYLTQGMMTYFKNTLVDITYMYEENEELLLNKANSAWLKTLAEENPNFRCKIVALDKDPKVEWENWFSEVVANRNLTEVRLHKGKRWVKEMKPLPANEQSTNESLLIKPNQTYLITGGMGGLGLIFAKYLLEKEAGIQLILTGRSPLSTDKQHILSELQEKGRRVDYYQADISIRSEVRTLIETIKKQYGPINGIIHSAGVLQDGFILKKQKNEMEAVLAPKVHGALWLDEATKNESMDFFVLFSSLSGEQGNLGQSDYAFANAFLDALAQQRHQTGDKRRFISFNWPLWLEGRMGVSPEVEQFLEEKMPGLVPLRTNNGLLAFEKGLTGTKAQIVVVEGSKVGIQNLFSSGKPKEIDSEPVHVSINDYSKYEKELEHYLINILAKETKLANTKISISEALEAYGIESVMVINMTRALEADFGKLSKTLFFEYQTIEELRDYLLTNHSSKLEELFSHKTKEVQGKIANTKHPNKVLPNTFRRKRPQFSQDMKIHHSSCVVRNNEDIAIIGLSGRYPMANNLEEFWNNLKAGKDCITEIPKDRWNHDDFFDSDKQKKGTTYSKWGGFIEDVDKFDPLVFHISPREAKLMDPQERLFLQTVWHTMEDAGYTKNDFLNEQVGVFVGAMYAQYQMMGGPLESIQDIPSSSFSSIANRVSYFFNFHGPSIAVDTMCSSSLTAIHQACKSIQLGESDVAFAGGVNVSIHPHKYLLLGQGKFVSTDGKCRAFGEGGDGYVPGEGVGAVLLKPLDKAIQDGDHIYGVIKSTSVNHGGKTNGYSVPNPIAQADLISNALEKANINPRRLSYIETHGTGTVLGDPIEITGLNKAFEPYNTDKGFCAIGSVKSNIGHLESAAGIAGLTKLLLQMKYKELVPSIHTETPNPHIDFEKTPFYVQREWSKWETSESPRLAGLSSFGAGGSNAHLIVEEWVDKQPLNSPVVANQDAQLIILSAKNKQRLKEYANSFIEFLERKRTNKTNEQVLVPEKLFVDIQSNIAEVADVPLQDITKDEELTEYGFDQAMMARLAQNLSDQFQIEISQQIVYENNSIEKLVNYLWDTQRATLFNYYQDTSQGDVTNTIQEPSLLDIAHTLQVGREAMEERLAVIVDSKEELLSRLKQFLDEQTHPTILQGSVKKKDQTLPLFDEDEDIQELVNNWIRKGKLDKLALLWINGVEIDWKQLNIVEGARRISLPVYPFARDRYWIDYKPSKIGNQSLSNTSYSLINRLDSKASLSTEGLVFTKTITPDLPLIRDHLVQDEKVLPGAIYLEMVMEACRLLEPTQSIEIRRVVWQKPIIVQSQPIAIQIVLTDVGDSWKFELQSNLGEKVETNATGFIQVKKEKMHPQILERNWFREVKARCKYELTKQEVYTRFNTIGLDYGPFYQPLNKLWGNGVEALAQLEVPYVAKQTDGSYVLHPSLLDGALQIISGIDSGELKKKETLVPFSIERVLQLDTLPSQVLAYVVEEQPMQYNIKLVDQDANVCLIFEGVSVRKLTETKDTPVLVDTNSIQEVTSKVKGETTHIPNQPMTIPDEELHEVVERKIIDSLADVLQIDLHEFDPHAAFMDFGVDSVLAVEIINRINEELSIQLRSTDLFNYTSIDMLTSYIIHDFKEFITPVSSQLDNQEEVGNEKEYEAVNIEPNQEIEKEQNKQEQTQHTSSLLHQDEIAIIGMSGQFPGARNLDEYWENLENGVNTVSEIDRWEEEEYYSPNEKQDDKSYSKWMGQLADIDQFDPLFFNLSPKEAEMIDPQQRLFLMEAWRALEDAGYTELASNHLKYGVFVGCGTGDYMDIMKEQQISPNAYMFMGNDESILPARISYFLNLKGPSLAINTACSSSLVAVHLACESIRTGTSDMALAGGISILNTPRVHVLASRAGMLSPDGQCKAFDSKANGFVPSEGVGVVVLKPLKKALADGDQIYGVIKGSGINQDGKTNGITAPSAPSQTSLELDVYQTYHINPADISYVEAHGTGTKLGDPIEIAALTDAFGQFTQEKQYCAIGSVKSNIGHALPAAGIAGLLKILLSLKHKKIVPSLLLEKENEHIGFRETPFYVNTQLKDWEPRPGKKRLSAISSFGFSGTNAHMVIEEAPNVLKGSKNSKRVYMIPISAKSEQALNRRIQELDSFLGKAENKEVSLTNLAYTLHISRSHFPIRTAFIAANKDELRTQLQNILTKGESDYVFQHNLERNPVQQRQAKKKLGEELLKEVTNDSLEPTVLRAKFLALAEFYTKGYDLNWEQLYANIHCQRVSLPTYPFDLQSCWVPQRLPGQTEKSLEHGMNFPKESILLRKQISSTDPIVQDHQIIEKKLYPGVGYLQFAHEALQKYGIDHVTLNNVLWLQPLEVDSKDIELTLCIDKQDKKTHFEIGSSKNGEQTIHSKGEFVQKKEWTDKLVKETLPINDIQKRCTLAFSKNDLYSQLSVSGMKYGPYYQNVEQIWSNNDEALSSLQLSEAYKHELNQMPLHPGLMDAALHTISGLVESDQALLPFAIDQVEIYSAIGEKGYAYATPVGSKRFNITITDSDGSVCIKLLGITLVSNTNRATKQDFYYRPYWVEQELPIQQENMDVGRRVLFIHPENTAGLQQALANKHYDMEIFRIQLGIETKRVNSNVWELNPTDEHGLEQILSAWNKMDLIYFMGGIQTTDVLQEDEGLELSQQNGVIALFHLVKVLGRKRGTLTLKVVTNNIFSVQTADKVLPASSSLHGFTKSLAKENPSWKVKLIDVSLWNNHAETDVDMLPEIAERVVVEPAGTTETEVAIRYGKRYVQLLEPIQLPPVKEFPFKQNGCYVILGGAGGIGIELSKYISKQVQANLVLIGRSPLDQNREQKLQEIRENGSEVLYLQADALQLTSMEETIAKVKEKFGKINGVIHSAIVLHDSVIANMNYRELRVALDAKVQGSYNLYRAVANESLDFMLFFSSVQSFSGNPGQSNYAAGCTFKDAFAQYVMQTVPYPVRIINWGYWGTVGIVSSEEYNKRLAAQGVKSIQPAEGMEAIIRVMANRFPQVVPFKVEKRVLNQLGVDTEYTATMLPNRPSVWKEMETVAHPPLLEATRVHHIKDAFDSLAEFAAILLLHTFKRLGAWNEQGEEYTLTTLQTRLNFISKYQRFLSASMDILQRNGFVERNKEVIKSTAKVLDQEVMDTLKHLETRKEQLMVSYPEIKAHLNLLWTSFSRYPDILTGVVPATDVMFPNSSMDLVEHIYRNNEMADHYNHLVVWNVQMYLEHAIPILADRQKVKILEIGAGTGGTSSHVFKGIRQYANHLEYVYTDISSGFTQYGKRMFGKENPYVDFKVLDIEKEVTGQGFNLGDYDIILATNVLHATRNINNTLFQIKNLLKTNGWLIINETTQVHDFATLTFGLLNGWWLYEDKHNRLPNSPLLHPSMWDHLCKDMGYEKVELFGDVSLGQHVIVAESNGIIRQETNKIEPLSNDTFYQPKVEQVSEPRPVEPKRQVVQVNQNHIKTIDYTEKIVLDSIEKKLGLNKDKILVDKDFSTYGVDSISGVDLINEINEQLGITLRTTVLFDYKTIKELVDYITREYHEQISEPIGDHVEQELEIDRDDYLEQDHPKEELDLDDYIIENIIHSMEQTLGIGRDTILLEKSFSEYGIDSISGVNLITTINERLDIVLRTTVLFDYTNVKELFMFIKEEHGQQLAHKLASFESEVSYASVTATNSKEELLEKLAKGELSTSEVISLWR